MINKKIEGLFFFQFSDGEYSDYGVGGIYIADHKIDHEEWVQHLSDYRSLAIEKMPDYSDWQGREAWRAENNPEKSFQKLHQMVLVEHKEFHLID